MQASFKDRDRLYEQLMGRSITNADSGCYIWTGSKLPNGYVSIRLPERWEQFRGGETRGSSAQRPREYIHRLVWKFWVGPIPHDHSIDHVAERGCIDRACWNLLHLEAVPHAVNCERRDVNGVVNQHGTYPRRT